MCETWSYVAHTAGWLSKVTVTAHPKLAANGFEIGFPFASVNMNFTGIVDPRWNVVFEGGDNLDTPNPTTYAAFADAVFPALSVAVQITVFAPAEVVVTEPHDCDATPEPPTSDAPALADAAPLSKTGFGLTAGLKLGAVVSTLYVALVLVASTFPALSVDP
jgi:hypothetical protein